MFDQESDRVKKSLTFSFYFILFAAYASFGPFIVLYYQEAGFSGTQIGLLAGLIPLVTLISVPFWTRLADASRRHRLIMNISILVGAVGIFLIPSIRAFAPMLVVGIILNGFLSSVPSFADSATMFMLGSEKDMYGRIRLGGTLGFGIAAPVAGILVENHGLKMAFWSAAGLYLVGLLISQSFEYSAVSEEEAEKGKISDLLSNPGWLLFLALAFAAGMSFASINNYLFPYMREIDIKESMMGIAVFVSTLAEIPIMFFGNRLTKWLGINRLLLLGMVMCGVRPLLYTFSSSLVPVLLVQLLNGLAFPVMWMAAVAYAEKNAPQQLKTTAQGLLGAMCFGVGAAAGGFLGGVLLENLSGKSMFGILGGIVLGITLLVALIQRRLPGVASSQKVF